MVLDAAGLRSYCLENLTREKRKAVRKAIRAGLAVRRIGGVEDVIDDMRAACISTAERTGYGRPPRYYSEHAEEWRRGIRAESCLPNREWWGVYSGPRLVGYLYAYLIEGTMLLDSTKFHADALSDRPSDILHFVFLEYCRELNGCVRVSAGNCVPATPSIDGFKESHGFRRIDYPAFTWYNPVLRLALRVGTRSRVVKKLQTLRGPIGRAWGGVAGRLERMATRDLLPGLQGSKKARPDAGDD